MLSDVIAAILTPPGRSAVALLRVSGTDAHRVAAAVLRPFEADPARVARRAQVVHPQAGDVIDEALYVAYRAPGSYTGENTVEISTHGGLLVPGETLGALFAAGARPALPGEFTRRAVLNGKLDLLQAEAVGDLVDATSPAQRRAALSQLDRGLSRRISQLRSQVLDLEALVSYEIDFPEEDSGPVPPERIQRAIDDVRAAVEAMLAGAAEGERLREGAVVVIAGPPNAGKSSLFNALLGVERAIVTEMPGTTRDAIEAPATCGGFPFRLVDTAGIRESDDLVERLGIEVSRRYLSGADLVVFCSVAGEPPRPGDEAFLATLAAPVVRVLTKSDLSRNGDARGIRVSSTTGEGLAMLRDELARRAFSSLSAGGELEPVVNRARHRAALARASEELADFDRARASGMETVVAATHLRAAVTALEEIVGVVTGDDVLDRLFATFCVGK